MKSIFVLLVFSLFSFTAFCQTNAAKGAVPDPTKKIMTVEASCGKCKLDLPGKTCELAVRINSKAYYVDGVSIDDLGDAHAHDGFCNAIRKAEVQGEIVDNRFKLTYIKLLPEKKDKIKGTKN
jgi:hypothetical protein